MQHDYPHSASQTMAAYMNANVPLDALVETPELEMGFLINRNCHYPPQAMLYRAVNNVWLAAALASYQGVTQIGAYELFKRRTPQTV